MDLIFREWLFELRNEAILDDEDIKEILSDETKLQLLVKEFFQFNWQEIYPWIQTELKLFQEVLEKEDPNMP